MSRFQSNGVSIPPNKVAFECNECGNTDNDKLMIIADAPWVVECCKCGHPNDARWDHDMIDVYRSGAS